MDDKRATAAALTRHCPRCGRGLSAKYRDGSRHPYRFPRHIGRLVTLAYREGTLCRWTWPR